MIIRRLDKEENNQIPQKVIFMAFKVGMAKLADIQADLVLFLHTECCLGPAGAHQIRFDDCVPEYKINHC